MIYYQILANNFKSKLYTFLTDALLDAMMLVEFEIVQVTKGSCKLMAKKEL